MGGEFGLACMFPHFSIIRFTNPDCVKRISRFYSCLLVFWCGFVINLLGVDKVPITSRDLWECKRLGNLSLSPDGRQVVFSVQEWSVEKNKNTTALWTVSLSKGDPRRLTAAEGSDSAPTWSPDGKRIAFVSKRGQDENSSLYIIPVDGGEAEKILELPFAISSPTWLPDGNHILVGTTVIPEVAKNWSSTNQSAMKKEVKRRKDSKVTAKVTEDRQFRYFDRYLTEKLASRLLKINRITGEITDLTPNYDRWFQPDGSFSFDVSPDGKQVVLVKNSTDTPYREFLNYDLFLIQTSGDGTKRNLTAGNLGHDTSPKFSSDGKSVYYKTTKTSIHNGESTRLARLDLGDGSTELLTLDLDYSVSEFGLSGDGKTIWFLAEEKGAQKLFKIKNNGKELKRVYESGTSSGLQVENGSVVFLNNNESRPDELYCVESESSRARALTKFNDSLTQRWNLGRSEEFWFEGAGGDKVHGYLVYPPDYDSGKRYPLVHVLHGGPHTMAGDAWSYRWNSHAIAAPGYVVARVNRHGSTGFGERFAQSIVNQWGEKPFEDIMRSTDYLLNKMPNLDTNRLAATGASYGGYLAAWILGHTDRFACIIDHAGVNNSYSQFGCDVPHGFSKVMGGTPWENVDGLQKNNPMFYARNFKTPTLVIHGELDYRVPYGNGLELYAVLQALGVDSRLVIYPNENHWILSPQNSIHWYYEFHDWLARYLKMPRLSEPRFEFSQP